MKYFVIVARPEDGSILALSDTDGWTLPSFTPDTTDTRVVEHINAEIRRQLGFETWTLKCAARGGSGDDGWRIFIAAAREMDAEPPPHARWVGQARSPFRRFCRAYGTPGYL